MADIATAEKPSWSLKELLGNMSCVEENNIIKLTLDQAVLDIYNKYY